MTYYPVPLDVLEKAVTSQKASWLDDAKTATERLLVKGSFDEISGIGWSEIKDAYRNLQHQKCIYCEIRPGSDNTNAILWDVEHYRPKSKVSPWPSDRLRKRYPYLDYAFSTGGPDECTGYYWLAYSIQNYAACCKSCNSTLKRDYFPIASKRQSSPGSQEDLKAEQPLLLFPFGEWGDDPTECMTFDGLTPIPTGDEAQRLRGQVTIDFFRLSIREDLLEGRSQVIQSIWMAWEVLHGTSKSASKQQATEILEIADAPSCRHRMCAQAFKALCESDPEKASKIATEATKFLLSKQNVKSL